MAVFRYFAVDRGKLVPGHSAGTEYSIELALEQWTPFIKKKSNVARSLSGRKFTVLHDIEERYRFVTIPTEDQSIIDGMIELFSSVAAGETFVVDPLGTIAAPIEDIDVVMDGDYQSPRVNQTEFRYSGRVEAA